MKLASWKILSLAFLNWDSQQGRDLAMSGCIKQKFQLGQSCSYIIRKVWYHQIWIQNNLGFMVLILMYRLTCSCMFGLIFWVARSRGGHVADGDLIGEHRIMRHSLELNHLVTRFTKTSVTGKSFSEALILELLTHNMRLFIEFPEKYKFRTCCVQILFWMSKQKDIFCTQHFFGNSLNNLIMWVNWCKNEGFWKRFICIYV